jgi:predicted AAA+ superfamily ATPase
MSKFKRIINLNDLVVKKSHFLFGPRGTGKSFLIRENFSKDVLIINLLKSEEFFDLNLNPEKLRERINPKKHKIVVIDEVQKIPQLLNEVHYMIEEYKIHFLLTGSSTRRLKAANTNMLGGRARKAELFALSYFEIENFNLEKYMRFGGLPGIIESDDPREDLSAYVGQYINEEIKLESNIRKIDFFHRFLENSALYSSEIVNFANISRDIGVSEPTVKSYYQILEDTLIGFQLLPWTKGRSRKSVTSSKFYFFDTGVLHTILRSPDILDRNSDIFGKTFEQFIAQELRAFLSYKRKDFDFNFWRSLEKDEVDFIINNEIAIEVKSSKKVKPEHLKGLIKILDEGKFKKRILITHDPIEKIINDIHCMNWKNFLDGLWAGEII